VGVLGGTIKAAAADSPSTVFFPVAPTIARARENCGSAFAVGVAPTAAAVAPAKSSSNVLRDTAATAATRRGSALVIMHAPMSGRTYVEVVRWTGMNANEYELYIECGGR